MATWQTDGPTGPGRGGKPSLDFSGILFLFLGAALALPVINILREKLGKPKVGAVVHLCDLQLPCGNCYWGLQLVKVERPSAMPWLACYI